MTDRSNEREALISRIIASFDAHPDKIAVRSSHEDITYRDLAVMVGQICNKLSDPDLPRSGPIGLLLERSAPAYASMFASIALGRPYVPLNPRYPQSRLQEIIHQAEIKVVVCAEKDLDRSADLGIDHSVPVEGSEQEEPTSGSDFKSFISDSSEGLAYILFTSGSTGKPKGVPISYCNLLCFVENLESVIEYQAGDICTQVSELSFDFSVHEIYLALLNGCTICPAREIDLYDPGQYVERRGITNWVAVPSLARVALRNKTDPERLATLRLCIFNGEALTAGLAREWHQLVPSAEIWNTYGPTECTVAVTAQCWSDTPGMSEADVVSLGSAFQDCSTALLVSDRIVPTDDGSEGATGELLLSTPQQFEGYLDPELPLPFVQDDDGPSFYRTGDKVLWKDQRLFYLGRIDHQVKIRGHRIELQEIECRIRSLYGIEALVVIAFPAHQPEELILFFEGPADVPQMTPDTVGLPAYMVPGKIVHLEALPVTPHGKVDRHALLQYVGEGG